MPAKWVYWPTQVVAERSSHAPPMQHAPVGPGHGLGVQTEPADMDMPAQPDGMAMVHAPLGAQQAAGWGHGLGEQTVPAPMNTLLFVLSATAHDVDGPTVHTPVLVQHAPAALSEYTATWNGPGTAVPAPYVETRM